MVITCSHHDMAQIAEMAFFFYKNNNQSINIVNLSFSPVFLLQVQRNGHTGIVTVQGNGQLIVRNLNLHTDILNIHDGGSFSANGKGFTSNGLGSGGSSSGGGYGGRGGATSATGKILECLR